MYKRKTKDIYVLYVKVVDYPYWEELETADDYKTIKYYLSQNEMIYPIGTQFKIAKRREKVDN